MTVPKHYIFAFFLSLLWTGEIAVCQAQNPAASETPVFDRLKAMFEGGSVFSSSFSHEYRDSFTGEHQASEGQIWIGKTHYKISGDRQVMVVDGETSTVYDETKNRVIISEYIEEEDDFAPSRMLQGVDDSFSVTEQPSGENETLVELTSDDPFAVFTQVSIYLDSNGSPLRIEAVDQADNELITRFEAGEFTDQDQDPELFRIDIPEEADYIDLRYGQS